MSEYTPEIEVARRVKGLREAVDLSVEAVAEAAGTTPEAVAAFEAGERDIPVSFLFKLAKLAGADLTALLTGDEAKLRGYALVRKGEGYSVDRRKIYAYRSLAHRFHKPGMEPFIVTVPASQKELDFNAHAGEEFVYMLEGRMEAHLHKEVLVLNPGDSLYFKSTIPHALRALDGGDARFLDVIL